ncbi:MAG: hypothetical protein NNA23_09560 [Nitrospira sp.]|jgi:hypothetical protein|uniref:Uncharacterized protein n=1 Tax=Candidatus Nitrospira inopinata TaxID=1715989 RepID=A0A0S4KTD3_9BACT|nr:hypothetical protein [Candidatus Nitrospira inopinata]MCP9452915.1 hypothetical protein [Nitrospira sp.]CUQ66398.1 protein of unknown function [Candidatus Nitrospira inopinata]
MATKKQTTKDTASEPVRCSGGVCDPRRTQGLKAPAPKGTHTLVNLTGPGLFLSANVTKQGGPTDLTFVILEIDGRNVVNFSFAAARNVGLTQANPYGIQYLSGAGVESFAIGWPSPLVFKKSLKLSVTVNETDVVQIVGNVVTGSL